MPKVQKILIDLPISRNAGGGSVRGIPQDIIRTYSAIRKYEEIFTPSLLIYPGSFREANFAFPVKDTVKNQFLALSEFFGDKDVKPGLYTYFKDNNPFNLISKSLGKYVKHLMHFYQNDFRAVRIDLSVFGDYLWRKVFFNFYSLEEFRKIVTEVYFSNISTSRVNFSSLSIGTRARLNTSGFDMVIFNNPSQIKVSPHTKKLVRFHDAMQLKNPDFSYRGSGELLLEKLKICKDDSFFICNSDPTREDLIKLIPEIEDRSFVVPCIIPEQIKKNCNFQKLISILSNRLSNLMLDEYYKSRILNKIKSFDKATTKYIFHIGAFEPKKNLLTLVKAWKPLYKKYKIPLVVCSYLGYRGEEVTKEILEYVREGSIIHLQNLTNEELIIMYSHASVFVFPSLDEGFGMPPLEAMRCECPTIVSDIPAHKWVFGDASIYVSPYNAEDMRGNIELLLSDKKNALRSTLIERGLKRSKLFSQSAVAKDWYKALLAISKHRHITN